MEILNNIIQYQFDGNSSLIYTIIRKRLVFYNLLNLQTDQKFIDEALTKIAKKNSDTDKSKPSVSNISNYSSPTTSTSNMSTLSLSTEQNDLNKELEAGLGLKTTLAETPSIAKMTENTISCMNKEDTPVVDKNSKLFEKNLGKTAYI